MSDAVQTAYTLEYHVLRVCERLHLSERKFFSLTYAEQLRLLAYDQLRREESAVWPVS